MTEDLLQTATRLGYTRQQAEQMRIDHVELYGEEAGLEEMRRFLDRRERSIIRTAERRREREAQAKITAEACERFEARRTWEYEERQSQRSDLSLVELTRENQERMRSIVATAAAVSAPSYETRTTRGKAESREPPRVSTEDLERLRGNERAQRNLAEDQARELDAAQGLAPPRNILFMGGKEKDDEIIERWEGVHSSVVARQAPHLGSEQTIQRIRRKNFRHGDDGRPGYRPRESRAA